MTFIAEWTTHYAATLRRTLVERWTLQPSQMDILPIVHIFNQCTPIALYLSYIVLVTNTELRAMY